MFLHLARCIAYKREQARDSLFFLYHYSCSPKISNVEENNFQAHSSHSVCDSPIILPGSTHFLSCYPLFFFQFRSCLNRFYLFIIIVHCLFFVYLRVFKVCIICRFRVDLDFLYSCWTFCFSFSFLLCTTLFTSNIS